MARGVSNAVFVVVLAVMIILAGFIGFMYGAGLLPIAVTKTITATLIRTETIHRIETTTVKGDMNHYMAAIDFTSQILKILLYDNAISIQKFLRKEVTEQWLASKFENSSKSLDTVIEMLAKNPPPEEEVRRYRETLESLIKLKISYNLLAESLITNNQELEKKALELNKEAVEELSYLIYM